ncbi:MAG: hypothetical protein IBJ11_05645 [Phycisphaerales bacterium]|nr:hypothetical protein [Phycisphaerales bacterium]
MKSIISALCIAGTLSAAAAAPNAPAAAPSPAAPAGAATAAPRPEHPTTLSDNAALWYWRAFAMTTPERRKQIDDLAEQRPESPECRLDARAVEVLSQQQDTVGELIRGSARAGCDFGLDYDAGAAMLLPHLPPLRASIRLLGLDARRLLDAGDAAGATERLAAGYRMARHASNDRTLISSLVSLAMFRYTDGVVRYALDRKLLDARARAALREALAGFDAADPFALKRSILDEKEIFGNWMLRQVGQPDAAAVFAALGGGDKSPAAAMLKELTRADDPGLLRADLQSALRAYDEAAAAIDAPDGEQRFADIERRVQAGEFGVSGRVLLPALGHLRKRYADSRSAVSDTLHLLADPL